MVRSSLKDYETRCLIPVFLATSGLIFPRTLSKIHSQLAMNALLAGLLEEDRSIRFQAILAIEEMARRFSNLKLDRDIVESAIVSDVMLYSQRFAIFYVLFANGG